MVEMGLVSRRFLALKELELKIRCTGTVVASGTPNDPLIGTRVFLTPTRGWVSDPDGPESRLDHSLLYSRILNTGQIKIRYSGRRCVPFPRNIFRIRRCGEGPSHSFPRPPRRHRSRSLAYRGCDCLEVRLLQLLFSLKKSDRSQSCSRQCQGRSWSQRPDYRNRRRCGSFGPADLSSKRSERVRDQRYCGENLQGRWLRCKGRSQLQGWCVPIMKAKLSAHLDMPSAKWPAEIGKLLAANGAAHLDAIVDSAGGDMMNQVGKILKLGGRVVCYGMCVRYHSGGKNKCSQYYRTAAPTITFTMRQVLANQQLLGKSKHTK